MMEEVLLVLKDMQERPVDSNTGICRNLAMMMWCTNHRDTTEEEEAQLVKLFRKWPEGTGDGLYPVPSPDCKHPFVAAELYADTDDMWSGLYGESRKRLLAYLIAELESSSLPVTN